MLHGGWVGMPCVSSVSDCSLASHCSGSSPPAPSTTPVPTGMSHTHINHPRPPTAGGNPQTRDNNNRSRENIDRLCDKQSDTFSKVGKIPPKIFFLVTPVWPPYDPHMTKKVIHFQRLEDVFLVFSCFLYPRCFFLFSPFSRTRYPSNFFLLCLARP